MVFKLVCRRRSVVEQAGGGSKGGVSNLVRDVDAYPVRLEERGVSVEVGPRPLDFGEMGAGYRGRSERADRERRVAAVSHDLCRNPLVDLALGVSVVDQRAVGVRVHVDEAGNGHMACGVYRAPSLRAAEVADCRDLAVVDSDIGLVAGLPATVDDCPFNDDCVERHIGFLRMLSLSRYLTLNADICDTRC